VFSCVLWRFMTKKIVYAHVNKKLQVFTPELWWFVCLIFDRVRYKHKILSDNLNYLHIKQQKSPTTSWCGNHLLISENFNQNILFSYAIFQILEKNFFHRVSFWKMAIWHMLLTKIGEKIVLKMQIYVNKTMDF